MNVNFCYHRKDNSIITDYCIQQCYHLITYGSVPMDCDYIRLYQPETDIVFDDTQIKSWIRDLNKWGFPCSYSGIIYGNYTFIIPIRKGNKQVYSKKIRLTSVLTLIRYLYEHPDYIIEYNKILEAIGKRVCRFKAMQLAHAFKNSNPNHLIRSSYLQSLTSLKAFRKIVKDSIHSIYNNNYPAITQLWSGKNLIFDKDRYDIKKLYKLTDKGMYPKTKIYVVGSAKYYANWLPNSILVKTLEESDVVMFTGGEDVNPELYGEPLGKHTYINAERDLKEVEIFKKARIASKKMLGICRGSQFLCVMAGGKLVQHQANPLHEHPIFLYDGHRINITSTHHQAAYPFLLSCYNYSIIGYTKNISPFHLDGNDKEINPSQECEIVLYRNIKALGIQGHPEMASYQQNPENAESLKYLKELFIKFITNQL